VPTAEKNLGPLSAPFIDRVTGMCQAGF